MNFLAIIPNCAGLLVVLLLAYVAGACLFGVRDSRSDLGWAIVWFVTGLCLLSFFFLLSKILGSALVFFMGLPLLLLALYAHRRPDLRADLGRDHRMLAGAIAISMICASPVVLMGIRMGTGDFPPVFFGADSPYFLHQAYSLASTASYPPPSFEFYGLALKYHYGAQAFVALTSLLTGLKPHFVMFIVVEPLLMALTGLLIYDICRQLTGRPGAALLCLLLVLLGSKQYFINYLDPSAWIFLASPEAYNFRYPNLPNVAGLLIALGIVRCLLDFQRRNARLAALFLLCMLPVFKLPFVVTLGAGLAVVYLYEMRAGIRTPWLLEISGAALLSLACFMLFSFSPIVANANIEWNALGFLDMTVLWQDHTMLFFLTLALVTGVVTRHRLSGDMIRLLALALSPYILFLAISYENVNQHQNQIFDVAVGLASLFTSVYVVSAWHSGVSGKTLNRAAAISGVACLIGPGTISLLNHVWIVSSRPEAGHEYVDNRAIADALMRIPVANTLIATNDVRYPANDYSRDYRQFQLAGIFGHRNLASNFSYGFGREEGIVYAELPKLFQAGEWPGGQIALLRQKIPVTHLLIHKRYRHATDIPLELVFENTEYAVYRF